MRAITLTIAGLAIVLASLGTAAAVATGDGAERGGAVDTTPPVPDFTPKERQDLDHALKHGIRGTCRTVDNETPVDCRLVALRKGRELAARSVSIVPPYYGYVIDLPIARADRKRLRRADPPIMVKLRLRVSDPAGNAATATEKIELVKGLYG